MADERERNPQATAGSEGSAFLELIPLHSTNLLTVLDENGVIQYESPSIERIYGFDPAEPVGDHVAEYFHPEDRDRVVEAFQRVVSDGEYTAEAVEYRHERADDGYIWVESVAASNPTPDGNYVVNTRDISDRKEHELELERTNERLSEFAEIVSHDLRNPLNVAKGSVERMQETGDTERLADIEWAHDRMDELIGDLLTLAQRGDLLDETEPVALGTVSENCWRTVATDGATLVVETDRVVRADRHRLQQLLENLFRNSVEHGESSPTVTVGALPDRDGYYVADDGPGIPDEKRESVFETGYSTSDDGTGLGLRIVERIARAHGWEITLTTSEAGGARFEFGGVEFES
jgi:PAS domain S-box-containing protein